jgi:hypothetical protein
MLPARRTDCRSLRLPKWTLSSASHAPSHLRTMGIASLPRRQAAKEGLRTLHPRWPRRRRVGGALTASHLSGSLHQKGIHRTGGREHAGRVEQ